MMKEGYVEKMKVANYRKNGSPLNLRDLEANINQLEAEEEQELINSGKKDEEDFLLDPQFYN